MNTLDEEPVEIFVDYLGMVHEFHQAFDIPSKCGPSLIGAHSFGRRMRLMLEELSEYAQAVSEGDIVEIADALADLLYVTFGTALEHGLPMNKIFRLVHESNMTKIGGHKDIGGKWIKPPTFEPADLTFLRGRTSLEGAKIRCQNDDAPTE